MEVNMFNSIKNRVNSTINTIKKEGSMKINKENMINVTKSTINKGGDMLNKGKEIFEGFKEGYKETKENYKDMMKMKMKKNDKEVEVEKKYIQSDDNQEFNEKVMKNIAMNMEKNNMNRIMHAIKATGIGFIIGFGINFVICTIFGITTPFLNWGVMFITHPIMSLMLVSTLLILNAVATYNKTVY